MKKAFFLSDLHLGASYYPDNKEIERGVVAFLDSIKNEAGELYLLGDILDYWFEYRNVIPRGYTRFLGKIAELSDAGIKITWLIGNHDIWIFDYLPKELGIEVVDGICERNVLGTTFSMQHGDAIGGSPKFQLMRKIFRNKVCQKLYSGIHPRWTVSFAHYCSKKSRINEKTMGINQEGLVKDFRQWCEGKIVDGDKAQYYIFGHLHLFREEYLPEGRKMIILPDWTSKKSYGVFDGREFYVMQHI